MLLLAPFASGAEHQTLALCRTLCERCEVTLLTSVEFARLLREDSFLRGYAAGLRVVPLGRAFPEAPASTVGGLAQRLTLYPRLQGRLWTHLRRLRPDVVHLILAPSFLAYAPFFRTLPIPVVVTLAGEMRYVRHFYGRAKRWAVQYATAQADQLVVCSADELENLRRVMPRAVAHATVLDNFTDTARFAPAADKAPLVTFAARLHPEKGALLFLEAVAQVVPRHPEARFALMGKGEQEPEVTSRIRSLGLEAVVQRGFATDLAPLFARASVFVSCQRYENLGSSSLLEAMAAGNAVVATDVGQTRQIVDQSVGYCVAPDAGALAAAIDVLLADPERARQLGTAARRRVIEGYSPGPYVERLLGIYESAIRRRGRRAATSAAT